VTNEVVGKDSGNNLVEANTCLDVTPDDVAFKVQVP